MMLGAPRMQTCLNPTEQLDRFAADMYECNVSPPRICKTNYIQPPWLPLYLQQLKKAAQQTSDAGGSRRDGQTTPPNSGHLSKAAFVRQEKSN